MKLVKFTATEKKNRYNGNVTFVDGQVHNLDDKEADRLVSTWPEMFSYVESKKAEPDDGEKSLKPKKNKLFRADKDK